jgi:simple sugar transport system ATP-binding protein
MMPDLPSSTFHLPSPFSVTAIELRDVTKRFGSVLANDGVNLRVEAGTIHGIVGENGAGKSTAMNILYGMYRPDSGTVVVDGEPRTWRSPADALAHGLGMVHQHFMLAGRYSVLDNIILGAEPARWGVIQRKDARRTLEELSEQYGLAVDWDRPVEELPVGLQQRVEILKLLFRRARILILDEPTGVLTPQETRSLFSNLKRICEEGKTILLVTHKLKEIIAFTQHVTVLRAGKVMGEFETAQTNPQMLADLMVGRKVLLDVQAPEAKPRAEMAIKVANLSVTRPRTTDHGTTGPRDHGPRERVRTGIGFRTLVLTCAAGKSLGLRAWKAMGRANCSRRCSIQMSLNAAAPARWKCWART